jgi:hypothetical protein
MDDPHHPILERPWLCEIGRLEWVAGRDDEPSSLDVTFTRGDVSCTLRFIDAQDVSVEIGGRLPMQCGEMVILDIRGRQLDGLDVQVTEGDASGSPLRLYARSVTEVRCE